MNRIVCPKCRANNMPGQTRCFQCGSSLPPPEAIAAGFVSAPPQMAGVFPPPPYAAHPERSRWLFVWLGTAAVLVLGCIGLMSARVSRAPQALSAQSPSKQAEELESLRRSHGIGGNTAQATSGDDETRRELNRLREKYGISTGTPHNPNDGNVPNGGAMTFDQWRRSHPDPSSYQYR